MLIGKKVHQIVKGKELYEVNIEIVRVSPEINRNKIIDIYHSIVNYLDRMTVIMFTAKI